MGQHLLTTYFIEENLDYIIEYFCDKNNYIWASNLSNPYITYYYVGVDLKEHEAYTIKKYSHHGIITGVENDMSLDIINFFYTQFYTDYTDTYNVTKEVHKKLMSFIKLKKIQDAGKCN